MITYNPKVMVTAMNKLVKEVKIAESIAINKTAEKMQTYIGEQHEVAEFDDVETILFQSMNSINIAVSGLSNLEATNEARLETIKEVSKTVLLNELNQNISYALRKA